MEPISLLAKLYIPKDAPASLNTHITCSVCSPVHRSILFGAFSAPKPWTKGSKPRIRDAAPCHCVRLEAEKAGKEALLTLKAEPIWWGRSWATGSLQWPTALWDGQRLLNQRTNTSHFATITAILPSTSPNSPAAWMHFWPGRAQQVTAAMDLSPNTAWSMHPFTAKLCSEV